MSAPPPSSSLNTPPRAPSTVHIVDETEEGPARLTSAALSMSNKHASPVLTEGSIALAEFTSLFRDYNQAHRRNSNPATPAKPSPGYLQEHVLHLLHQQCTSESTLASIACVLERESQPPLPISKDGDLVSPPWDSEATATAQLTSYSRSYPGGVMSSTSTASPASQPLGVARSTLLPESKELTERKGPFQRTRLTSQGSSVDRSGAASTAAPTSAPSGEEGLGMTPVTRRHCYVGAAALGLPLLSGDEATDDANPSLASSAHSNSELSSTSPATRVPRNQGRRAGVSAEPLSPDSTAAFVARVIPKTHEEVLQLRGFLKKCPLFGDLRAADLDALIVALERETYPARAVVLEEGGRSTDRLYVVAEGSCEVIKHGTSVGVVVTGSVFGELEIMYMLPTCAASIRCITQCTLYSLDEATCRRAIITGAMRKRDTFGALIMHVPFLRSVPEYERMKLAEAFVTKTYVKDECITRFGHRVTHIHFIISGEVCVMGRLHGNVVEVIRLHEGDVVGELEFLFNHLAVADVVVQSAHVDTACISRHHLEVIVGPLKDRLKEFVETDTSYDQYFTTAEYTREEVSVSVQSELLPSINPSPQRQDPKRVVAAETNAIRSRPDRGGEIIFAAPRAMLLGTARFASHHADAAAERVASSLLGASKDNHSEPTEGVATADDADGVLFRFPLSSVAEDGRLVVLGLREDGLILLWNHVLAEITNYPAEEVLGQNIYSFLLEEQEQQTMLQAVTNARQYAGDVSAFLATTPAARSVSCTLARSDGLTRAALRLTVVPPIASFGDEAANVVLAYGTEVTKGPSSLGEQSEWLSQQLRRILGNRASTYEERLHAVGEAVAVFESTCRALTVSTATLRIVNLRQVMGQVLMDFASQCVARGLAVRQRFEGLLTERVYVDAEKLPGCLRFAMNACLDLGAGTTQLIITLTVVVKNELQFLVINFNVDGPGFASDCVDLLKLPLNSLDSSALLDTVTAAEDAARPQDPSTGNATVLSPLTPQQRQQLRRVRAAVEAQGGTMLAQNTEGSSDLLFLIPFLPATAEAVEDATVPDPSTSKESVSGSTKQSPTPTPGTMSGEPTEEAVPELFGVAPTTTTAMPAPLLSLSAPMTSASTPTAVPLNFTTLVAEDTPALRNMLCTYLWERRHAVLPAYSFADIERLAGVADILLIDLSQSIVNSMPAADAIGWLREMSRHMAIVITARSFTAIRAETIQAAGFVTLTKPCAPVEAFQAIYVAEQRIAAVKHEAARIAMTRDTLSKNSRGAWRRGRLLGKGTFGEVYEAVEVLTGGTMAVKEMTLGRSNHRIEQFVDEIATMCSLEHPNIIHYFSCEESDDGRLIRVFMEYACGGTMQSLLSQTAPLPFRRFQTLLRDVTEGLAYLHAQHYVHCDIKTANVLLGSDGVGKIGDFGTARTLYDGQLLYEMQGSPLYMSPECMAAGEVDEDGVRIGYSFPTDVWSLGCVMMEMYTNKPPFAHVGSFNGPAGFTNFITSLSDTPDLSPLFGAPPCVAEFASACLNPDPTQRATAQQLLQLSIFSEVTDETTKSAVQALERAQLLHVLNKFVAFQEQADCKQRVERAQKYITRPYDGTDFFETSSESERGGTPPAPEKDPETRVGHVKGCRVAEDDMDDPNSDNETAFFDSSSTASSSDGARGGGNRPTMPLSPSGLLVRNRSSPAESSGVLAEANSPGHGQAAKSTLPSTASCSADSSPSALLGRLHRTTAVGSHGGAGGSVGSPVLSTTATSFPSRIAPSSLLGLTSIQNMSFRGADMEDVLKCCAAEFLYALHRKRGGTLPSPPLKPTATQDSLGAPPEGVPHSSFDNPSRASLAPLPAGSPPSGSKLSVVAAEALGTQEALPTNPIFRNLAGRLRCARERIAARNFFRVEAQAAPHSPSSDQLSSGHHPFGVVLAAADTPGGAPTDGLTTLEEVDPKSGNFHIRLPPPPPTDCSSRLESAYTMASSYCSPMSFDVGVSSVGPSSVPGAANDNGRRTPREPPEPLEVYRHVENTLRDLSHHLQEWLAAESGAAARITGPPPPLGAFRTPGHGDCPDRTAHRKEESMASVTDESMTMRSPPEMSSSLVAAWEHPSTSGDSKASRVRRATVAPSVSDCHPPAATTVRPDGPERISGEALPASPFRSSASGMGDSGDCAPQSRRMGPRTEQEYPQLMLSQLFQLTNYVSHLREKTEATRPPGHARSLV